MKTEAAVRYFGSKVKLARALGVTRAAISNWEEEVPLRRAYELEKITGGDLRAPTLAMPSDDDRAGVSQ